MLDVSDLVTAYGKIEALKGVSLHVESGKITCLLGPNGAGKTTLMMTIAGILTPRRGSIKLNENELVGLTPARIVSQGVALVPENRLVFPDMSVRENLMAGAYQRMTRRRSPPTLRRCTSAFRACKSAASSSPVRSPVASSRCWRSPAH
jgi:branched-chain amino acid transport system ATP-binding protein